LDHSDVDALAKAEANDVEIPNPTATRILDQGSTRRDQENELHKLYGVVLLCVAVAQIAAVNEYFVLLAFGVWHGDPTTFRVFTSSVFAEVIGLLYIVTHNLFPRRDR